MLKRCLWFLLVFCAWAVNSKAQQYAPLVVRADLSILARKGVGGAFEWQYSRKSAIAVQASWEEHEKADNRGLFNGDLVANFGEFQIDSVKGWGANAVHITHKSYFGEGRPLPVMPQFVGLSSLTLCLGHKFLLGKREGKWQWSLQPSLSLIRHHFYEIKQTFELVDEHREGNGLGYYSFEWNIREYYTLQDEKQAMREHFAWIPGLAYDVGLSRRLGRRWSVEARLSGLYNLQTAYKAPQPAPAKVAQARAHLFIAYAIGKMR